jgi:hypothetical protein
MKKRVVNIPPEVHLMYSIMRTDYKWKPAISEILDNSIDAIRQKQEVDTIAGQIHVFVNEYKDQVTQLWITDNGIGMDEDGLANCLKLGGSKKTSAQDHIGVFGVGLKTSLGSLGDKTDIISRSNPKDPWMKITWDPSFILKSGKYVAVIEKPSPEEVATIEDSLGCKDATGTAVKIMGVEDSELPKKGTSILHPLEKHCNRIYRSSLDPDSEFYMDFEILLGARKGRSVNKKTIFSPLYLKDEPELTEWFHGTKEKYEEITYTDQHGAKHQVKFKFAQTSVGSGQGSKTTKESGLGAGFAQGSEYKQGIYCTRGGREIGIVKGQSTLKLPGRVSNAFGELIFKDDGLSKKMPIKTDFGKKSVTFTDHFVKFLKSHMKDTYAELRKLSNSSRQKISASDEAIKKQSERILSGMLASDRQSPTTNGATSKTKGSNAPIVRKSQYVGKKGNLRIVEDQYGKKSRIKFEVVNDTRCRQQMFWSEFEDGIYTISLNKAHEAVERAFKNNPELTKFMYSMSLGFVHVVPKYMEDEADLNDCIGDFGNILHNFFVTYDSKLDFEPLEGQSLKTA